MKNSWPVGWKDYYEILQVIPEAEPEVIEGAYKRLAAKYHPDNKTTGDANRFTAIHEAHEILTHPGKRNEYDATYRERRANRSRGPTIPEDRRREKRPPAVRTPAPSKNFGIFCSIGSCFGVIDENGLCSVCGKAYAEESQRKIKEEPKKPLVDKDI